MSLVNFAEITAAHDRLLALKSQLDRIVSSVLPVEGVEDLESLEGELQRLKEKAEVGFVPRSLCHSIAVLTLVLDGN